MLLLFLLVSEGLGLRYLSQMEPDWHTVRSQTQENYALNFFVTTCIVFAIGTADYVLQMAVAIKLPPDYVSFQDLCSVANISVLMFDDSYRGYYIHGKSPTGSADLSSENLSLALEHEQRGKASMRGLVASRPDSQTFEINMPRAMV